MKNVRFLLLAVLTFQLVAAQNAGIGTTTPLAPLHLKSATAIEILRIEGNNPFLSFYDNALGYRGFLWGAHNRIELGTAPGSGFPVIVSPNSIPAAYFTATGQAGFGNSNPSERLDVNGNLNFTNNVKGVILNAADRPLITRGFDAFTSGIYSGLGRWGLFMEPNRLTLGIPAIAGKGLNITTYDANSAKVQTLLSVTQDGTTAVAGEINRPAKTGTANLLPVAYGSVNGSTGAIKTGTGNFTVVRTSTGAYTIDIAEEAYTNDTHVVTITTNGPSVRFASVDRNTFFSSTGFRVHIWNGSVNASDGDFSFVVYKP